MTQPSNTPQPDPPLNRCFGCKNRTGPADAVVLEDGVFCCRRCAEHRTVIPARAAESWSIEIIG